MPKKGNRRKWTKGSKQNGEGKRKQEEERLAVAGSEKEEGRDKKKGVHCARHSKELVGRAQGGSS
jgi:hypothetical protein